MRHIHPFAGRPIKISDEDYDYLSKFEWHLRANKNARKIYIVRFSSTAEGKIITTSMHREILGLTDSKVFCDHKDGDTFNNQRENLRACTVSENNKNRKTSGASSFFGVHKYRGRWRARMSVNGKRIDIGVFREEIDAAKAFDRAVILSGNEFYNLNFPNLA